MSLPVMSLRVLPILLALALAPAPGAAQAAADAAALAPPSGAAAGGPPLAVELMRVEEGPLTFNVALTGTIVAQDSIDMSFPQGGRVTEVLAEAGDRVRASQPLARTDAVQQQQVLAAAEAALSGARAAQEQAGQAAARASELLRRGIGTRAALDAAQQAQSAAQGQVESARTEVDRARRALEDTILTAPQDAVVTARSAEPGQIVGAAQTIVTLAALTGLEAVFATPDAPQLGRALGAPVTLKPLDRPGLALKATVTEIAPLVDPATASVTVRAAIMGAMDSSLLGAAVRGEVHLPAGTGIAVPWTALSSVGDEPAVWRLGAGNRVEIVPVEIERYQTGAVVLKSGVKVGDIIVGEGSQMLYPGRGVIAGKVRR